MPGVNPDKFYPVARAEARRQLGWESETRLILFPGKTTNPIKRFDLAEKVRLLVEPHTEMVVKLVPLAKPDMFWLPINFL